MVHGDRLLGLVFLAEEDKARLMVVLGNKEQIESARWKLRINLQPQVMA
jgi:hypothetical protein